MKSAAKGAFFVGSKAVGGIGLISDLVVYVDGYYKGYKKDIRSIERKKLILRKGGSRLVIWR